MICRILDGCDGRLIETDTNLSAAAADVALTRMIATVVIERGQANESGNGLAVVLTQFGEMGDERS